MLSPRVAALRRQSLETPPTLSIQRACLLTEIMPQLAAYSVPKQRALILQHLCAHKDIVINPGELIVGERGQGPQSAPTYPELCCHSLEDLQILNDRPVIPFAVSEADREIYAREIIPFWQGRSLRDILFSQMDSAWLDAYEAGIFTEFMEQRAPGHTVCGDKIYRKGFLEIQKDIRAQIAHLDFRHDPRAYDKREQLEAMDIACQAVMRFAQRHAEKAAELAQAEHDPQRRQELEQIAAICRRVPAHAPQTYWEALQTYWFVHLTVITELNTWDSFCPGRLDQHLFPFYERDVAAGRLTRDQARELLQCFFVKVNNQPAPPKVGVTAEESGTYTDFCNLNNGGLKRDGSDGVNEISYLVMDVIEDMHLLQPSSNLQLSRKTPDRYLRRVAQVIRRGWGFPSVFNADAVVEELVRQGKEIGDAREGGTSGCVEAGAFGREAYWLTGYLNLPKILEIALHNGVDPRSGKRIGVTSGDPRDFTSFEQLFAAWEAQMAHFIDIKLKGNAIIERLFAHNMPSPFLSTVIDDCVEKAADYNAGGARYNTSYIQGVGLGTLTDCFSALRYHVYDHSTCAMADLLAALDDDFAHNPLLARRLRQETPKYGNDDDYADNLMQRVFECFYGLVNGQPNCRGGSYRVDMLPTTCHIYFGSVTGATPDGRQAGQPLSEGISPVQGADRHGPTAVIKSAAKLDHLRTGGTLLNQKFTPSLLADDKGLTSLCHLIRTYFRLDGHHIQFNVVDADTLRQAQAHPDQYQHLIVRVAGYSDYFGNLSPALQEEIIHRTEQQGF